MTDRELTNKLTKFDYTNLWLEYSVLTIEHLIAQEQEFDNCDDKNTEHYRYRTFRNYLSSKKKLVPQQNLWVVFGEGRSPSP